MAKVIETAGILARFHPETISITYGAGGSSRARSLELVAALNKPQYPPISAHITVAGQSREAVTEQMDEWRTHGVRRFVALRGDMPDMQRPFVPHSDGFTSSLELMRYLRDHGADAIYGGAYPEGHPESQSEASELDHLMAKQDAGATALITQYFFEAPVFLRFRDKLVARGITIPIIPGILPIANFARALRFSQSCGASVPNQVHDAFKGLEDNPHESVLVGTAMASQLCQELVREGVSHIHLYTLNRADMSCAIARTLGRISS